MLNRNISSKNKFHFTSLGCARNLIDSEVMIGILLKAGASIFRSVKQPISGGDMGDAAGQKSEDAGEAKKPILESRGVYLKFLSFMFLKRNLFFL